MGRFTFKISSSGTSGTLCTLHNFTIELISNILLRMIYNRHQEFVSHLVRLVYFRQQSFWFFSIITGYLKTVLREFLRHYYFFHINFHFKSLCMHIEMKFIQKNYIAPATLSKICVLDRF